MPADPPPLLPKTPQPATRAARRPQSDRTHTDRIQSSAFKMPRAWVRLPSGRRLNLLEPTPFDFELRDLALGAGRTFRWGGHSVWDWPLSVAQHSLAVLAIGLNRHRATSRAPMPVRDQLAYLLHDASECLGVCFDPISPLKPFLGEGYARLDSALQAAVHTRFGLPTQVPAALKKQIKEADRIAAAAEAVHVAGWTLAECRETLGIRHDPLDRDPLGGYGDPPWQPWSAAIATDRFEAALLALLAAETPDSPALSVPLPF